MQKLINLEHRELINLFHDNWNNREHPFFPKFGNFYFLNLSGGQKLRNCEFSDNHGQKLRNCEFSDIRGYKLLTQLQKMVFLATPQALYNQFKRQSAGTMLGI